MNNKDKAEAKLTNNKYPLIKGMLTAIYTSAAVGLALGLINVIRDRVSDPNVRFPETSLLGSATEETLLAFERGLIGGAGISASLFIMAGVGIALATKRNAPYPAKAWGAALGGCLMLGMGSLITTEAHQTWSESLPNEPVSQTTSELPTSTPILIKDFGAGTVAKSTEPLFLAAAAINSARPAIPHLSA